MESSRLEYKAGIPVCYSLTVGAASFSVAVIKSQKYGVSGFSQPSIPSKLIRGVISTTLRLCFCRTSSINSRLMAVFTENSRVLVTQMRAAICRKNRAL